MKVKDETIKKLKKKIVNSYLKEKITGGINNEENGGEFKEKDLN